MTWTCQGTVVHPVEHERSGVLRWDGCAVQRQELPVLRRPWPHGPEPSGAGGWVFGPWCLGHCAQGATLRALAGGW